MIVGAGADLLIVPGVPAAVQILFAVRFVGEADELDGTTPHAVAVRLFDPDGQPLGEQASELTGDVTQIVPGYLADVTIPTGVVIDARQYGTYHVEFEIDDDSRRVPVHIVEPPAE